RSGWARRPGSRRPRSTRLRRGERRAARGSSRKQRLDLALDGQPLERLRLDLAHPLARQPERPADLLERLRVGIAVEAVPQLEDVALPLGQLVEGAVEGLLLEADVHLLLEALSGGRDQLAELRPAVLADRLVEARDRARGLAHLAPLLHRQ